MVHLQQCMTHVCVCVCVSRVVWDRAHGSENEAEEDEDEEEPLMANTAATESRDNDVINPWLKR